MSTVLNCVLFGVIGFALATAGISTKSWQFYVVLICTVGIKIIEHFSK